MEDEYKAREGTPIKDLEGLKTFLVEKTGKKYGEIDNAKVYGFCGPMKHPAFSERVSQYMIIIETEDQEKFEFVPTDVINELI